MTLEDAIATVNAEGWRVHMLWQQSDFWTCVLSHPDPAPAWHRYLVTLPTSGPTPADALLSALTTTPDCITQDIKINPFYIPSKNNILDLLGIKEEPKLPVVTRRL